MSHKFLNINWDLFDKRSAESKEKLRLITQQNEPRTNNVITYDRPLTYFLPPPLITSNFVYQDINSDPTLRENITNFFLNKTIKWVNNYSEFKNSKYW